ncbi:MAG TPA: magnesium transporter [Thermoanaerobaculia bacterium]|nr:magnesium transporter [Thermoanaerobaculia bacterium]
METATLNRRVDVLSDSLRKFVRRGARSNISRMLGKVRPEDVAAGLKGLDPEERLEVFRILNDDYPDAAGEVLVELEGSQLLEVMESLEPTEIAPILERIPVDDAVWVVDALSDEVQQKVLEIVDLEKLTEVQAQLAYDEDSAGRVMDTEFLALPETTTVQEAIQRIQADQEMENVFYLYVVDKDDHLVGVTSLRQLLLTRPQRTLGEIMKRSVIKANVDTDQEEVAQLAARYDLLAIPVTDDRNRLVGIVTVDDIIDIFKEEATEDFLRMVGSTGNELLYQDRPLRVVGIRLPWLFFNLVGGVVTGTLLHRFQVSFSEALFLLAFVPVVMGMGGNIGSQTSTITVRGLATGRISPGQGRIRRFLWQQGKVGALLATICALVIAPAALLLERNPWYAAVVACSLFLAMLMASLTGVLIPVLFQRLNIDPAVASGPLVTTGNDITGILIYFGLAGALIGLLVR